MNVSAHLETVEFFPVHIASLANLLSVERITKALNRLSGFVVHVQQNRIFLAANPKDRSRSFRPYLDKI